MKANELRIGNLVERDGNVLEVVRIAKDEIINYDLVSKSKGMHVNSGNTIPIPLTEELKTEFGNDKLVLVDKSGFVIFKNGYAYQFVFEDYPYIHTIQNLYFALTGEELEINLNNK